MGVLAVKLAFAPALVVGSTVLARHYGPRLGGLAAALPAVAGPVLLVFALEQGAGFASDASAAALLGVVALCGFIACFCRMAFRRGWMASLLAGWCAYAIAVVLLSLVDVADEVALVSSWLAIAVTFFSLPKAADGAISLEPPGWDLPMRALATVTLILCLAVTAERFGPELSGLLTPFPVIASVLAAFTLGQAGADETVRVMGGLLLGLFAFATFFYVLAVSLDSASIASAFTVALVACLAIQLVMLYTTASRGRRARR
ncbi:MAG: hypothetical protein WAO61_00310 [Solirubrobacterales bacterium]